MPDDVKPTLKLEDLAARSHWLRREIFEMVVKVGQGHIASALSQVEIVCALFYGGVMRYMPGEPDDPARDRLIVSKGHSTMGIYPVLADIGYFPVEELGKYGTPEGILRIYGDRSIPGVDATSGSLSQGPGIAAGFCLAAKRDGRDQRSYVIVSDGEHYEGSLWETALFASHYELDNLVVVVDRNRNIILGDTEELLRLDPLDEKWRSFGWRTRIVDGHSYVDLLSAFAEARRRSGRPTCIIADTVKGKGISYMEGVTRWHNTMPDAEEIAQARRDLETNCIRI